MQHEQSYKYVTGAIPHLILLLARSAYNLALKKKKKIHNE